MALGLGVLADSVANVELSGGARGILVMGLWPIPGRIYTTWLYVGISTRKS